MDLPQFWMQNTVEPLTLTLALFSEGNNYNIVRQGNHLLRRILPELSWYAIRKQQFKNYFQTPRNGHSLSIPI